jgi:hypothetical protein
VFSEPGPMTNQFICLLSRTLLEHLNELNTILYIKCLMNKNVMPYHICTANAETFKRDGL